MIQLGSIPVLIGLAQDLGLPRRKAERRAMNGRTQ